MELLKLMCCCLITMQLVTARHISLYDTSDSFSTNFEDWPNDAPATASDDGYQTFTRDGVTLRIKPEQQIIRIGGTNVPPEQMIQQAELMKGLEPVAVRQLLNTKQPVMRTTFENGQKRTSTYTLEPDGSILCKTVQDIDPKMLDAEFEKVEQRLKERKQQEAQNEVKPKPQTNWEWTAAPSPTTHEQPNLAPKQPQPARTSTAPHTSYPKLPDTWNQHSWSQQDPFNPAGLPRMVPNTAEDDFNDSFFSQPFAKDYESKSPTSVTTTTHTDKDGNTVQTTFTKGPNDWTRKTVRTYSQHLGMPSTTPQIPNLDDFLRRQYAATSTTPRPLDRFDVLSTTTPVYERPATHINIDDLPLMAVLNNGQPLDEHYLRSYPTELQPLTGGNREPLQTIHIDNITPTPEQIETTQVKTITKTLHGNTLPTAADLDPNMLAMLQRAGITPEDILAAKGNTITKTFVEPDGRVVKTRYRVRTVPAGEVAAEPPILSSMPSESKYLRPTYFPEFTQTPTHTTAHHYDASRNDVQFTPSTTTTTTGNPPQPRVRDREPLEPAITLNPIHIHPISQTPAIVSKLAVPEIASDPISEFLAKIDLTINDVLLSNGELVKTIRNDDGRELTVKFMLSSPKNSQK